MASATSGSPRPISRRTLWIRDAGLVLGLMIVQVLGSTGAQLGQPDRRNLDAIAYSLLVIGPALLALRRRWPVPVLVAVMAVTVTYYGAGYVYGPAFLSVFVALVSAVLTGHRTAAWIVAGTGLAGYFVLDWIVSDQPPSLASVAGHLAWLLLVLAVAEIVRIQRTRSEETRRARADEERRRVSEERLRIARELHDLLGHNMSLINVQASVALHLMDREPERARTALVAIKEASRGTLREVRAALDVLRGEREVAPRQPVPGLVRLPDLVSQFAAAGLRVTVTSSGDPHPTTAGVDLAAFRVVQEALTNVLRHSGASAADVALDHRPGALTVAVTDRGGPGSDRGASQSTGGSGIAGMRDRVVALGGEFTAGPLSDGAGFRVAATLPLHDEGGDDDLRRGR